MKIVESLCIVVAQPHEQAPPVRHLPPKGRGGAQRRPAVMTVDAHEQILDAPVKRLDGPGTRKSVHVILDHHTGIDLLPQTVGQPVKQGVPLARIERGRLVHGQGAHLESACPHGLQEVLSSVGVGCLPPVVHGQRGFCGPIELGIGRSVAGGQYRIDCHVQVTHLLSAAHQRMICEPDVRVRHVHNVDALNRARRSRGPIFCAGLGACEHQ